MSLAYKLNILLQRKNRKIEKVDKDGNKNVARFLASSLLNLVDNLTAGIDKITWKDCK